MPLIKKIFYWISLAFVFFLPWQTHLLIRAGELNGSTWEYGSLKLFATDILLIILLLISFIFLKKKKLKIVLWWPGLFILLAVTSVFVAADKTLAAFRLGQLVLAMSIGLVMIFNANKLKQLLVAFNLGMILPSGLAIWQFASQNSFASGLLGLAEHDPSVLGTSVVVAGGERWLRAYGSFSHPNILGAFIAIAFLISIYLWLNQSDLFKNSWRRIGWLVMLAIFTTALILSFSRGAWLGCALGTFLLLFGNRSWKVDYKKIVIAGLAVIIPIVFLGIFLHKPIISRMSSTGRLENISVKERGNQIEDAFTAIKNQPLLGVGIGNYTKFLSVQNPDQPAYVYQPVHNVYLLVATELGLIAFAFFLLFIFYALRRGGRLTPLLAAILAMALFDHSFWTIHSSLLLFWLVFFLSLRGEGN